MKKWPGHILLLLLALSVALQGNAQNEQPNWFFGDRSAITFKTDPPSFLPGSNMYAFEGCTVANDKDGNVLFYSNGQIVYNKNHEVMVNGLDLTGGNSCTMAALAVPRPGSTTIWYLFTVGDFGNTDGLAYSIIDMTLDNGAGAVIQKNRGLVNPVSEKVLAITHKNGKYIWIVTKLHNKDVYHTYLLTSTGLTNPVVSNAGNSLAGPYSFYGYMAGSPDGSLIAAVHGSSRLDVLCFDNATGKISDLYGFNVAPSIGSLLLYGLEFSSNGEYLYIANADSDTNYLFQYRLGANLAETRASEVILGRYALSKTVRSFGALKRGPDSRIYLAIKDLQYLGLIANPDVAGAGCNFQVNGFQLNGPPLTNGKYGLPSVYVPTVKNDSAVKIIDSCYTMTIGFIIDGPGVTNVEWDFGDGSKSNSLSPTHEYQTPGEYTVKVTYESYCQSKAEQIQVHPHESPVDFGEDTTLCAGQQLTLSVFTSGFTYLWQDGSTGPEYTVVEDGVYYVDMQSGDCVFTDTIRVTYEDVTVGQYTLDTLLCVGQEYTVDSSGVDGSMIWHDGNKDMVRTFSITGNYGFKYVEGCDTEKVALDLEFEQCMCFLDVPSAFTPNADHHNDVFRPVYDCWITSFHLEVYNRWGERIYVTDDPDAMWDGSYNGIRVPNGVYFYTVEYSTIARESDRKSGVLHVIR